MQGVVKRDGAWIAARVREGHLKKFRRRYVEGDEQDCWTWIGVTTPAGYGMFSVGAAILAHRFSYFLKTGDLPAGLVVRHRCDNPSCVNPAHLVAGTHKDNRRDSIERKRARGYRPIDYPPRPSIEQVTP
jgi:hypothetical protein